MPWLRGVPRTYGAFLMTDFPSSPVTEREKAARTLALAESQELILATSDASELHHASDKAWKDFLPHVDALIGAGLLGHAPRPAVSRSQLIKTIRSKARVAGHDAWEGGYYHLANAEEIADAILALSDTSTDSDNQLLKNLVDWAWIHATEGAHWPSAKTIDTLIRKAKERGPTQEDAGRYIAVSPPVREGE
jgi:hypothetical protein